MTVLVTVAVSTRDRAARLTRLLHALERQTLPPEAFEVVIVDDGSTDATAEILTAAVADSPMALRWLRHDEARGPAAGRNAAWRAGVAPLVAFTDDDCEPAADWLAEMIAAWSQASDRFVQGAVEPNPREAPDIDLFTRTLSVSQLGPWYQTANIAYPRSVLESLAGFDESHRIAGGEDTDLAWRALEEGVRAAWAPRARVYHAVHPMPPAARLRMALAWSDTVRVVKRHPGVRRHVHHRYFWRRSHALFPVAVAAALLTPRFPPAAIGAAPYVRHCLDRARDQGAPAHQAAWLPVLDAVEVFATVRGAVRYRTLFV